MFEARRAFYCGWRFGGIDLHGGVFFGDRFDRSPLRHPGLTLFLIVIEAQLDKC